MASFSESVVPELLQKKPVRTGISYTAYEPLPIASGFSPLLWFYLWFLSCYLAFMQQYTIWELVDNKEMS
jgi:hypothetical protein